jgi:hypothetical protein
VNDSESFLDFLDAMPDAVLVVGPDGEILAANVQCEAVLGYRPGELVSTSVDLLVPEELRAAHAGHRARYTAEPRVRPMGGSLELRALHHDGSLVPVEIRLSPLPVAGAGPELAVAVIRDITARKELEEQLRQTQKMEAIGHLAGGIAHDFNNLLTVIMGYTELVRNRVGHDAESGSEIAEVAKAAERAALLTRQLLAFSRKQVLELRVTSLNDVTAEVQTMLGRVIGEDIELTAALADDLAHVRVDVGQLEQVLLNLAVNARDAMPGGGKLTLETQNVILGESHASRNPNVVPGDYVMLAVTDTGHGMDAGTTSRIFEPFFTTKEPGAGTGLGLSTVYGIVKQSGGHVEVESEPRVGTSFRIYLPQAGEEAEALEPRALPKGPVEETETILFVEDDEALRRLGRDVLERSGYTVLSAGDGEEALELAQSYPDPIHLLMTDVLLPKLGGIELAERLAALRPRLKTLYTSGYDDAAADREGARAGTSFLQKPYGIEALVGALRELFDRPPADADASGK